MTPARITCLIATSLLLSSNFSGHVFAQSVPPEKLDATSQSDQRQKARRTEPPKPTPYLYGAITRLNKRGDRLEFKLSELDGIRVGDLLPVRRLIGGGALVAEAEVILVDAYQAVARVPKGTVIVGDEVVYQRNLLLPPSNMHNLRSLNAEITFALPGRVTLRQTYHGRIMEVTWSGPLDISRIQVEFGYGNQAKLLQYPATAISQMRVNGILMVIDSVKKTLVPAEILPLREKLREEAKRIHELRLAEIQANERVKIAQLAHELRHAEIQADERAKMAERDKELRLAEIQADERVKLAEMQSQRAYLDRALATAIAAREKAEQEAREWRRHAELAMNSSENNSKMIEHRSDDLAHNGNTKVAGFNFYQDIDTYKSSNTSRVLKFVGGFLSTTVGVAATATTGDVSLVSGAAIMGGVSGMWDAIMGE